MNRVGAQYVVYEDSGFLAESVFRIYPLMDRIVFLVGADPWNGPGDRSIPTATLRTIMGMPDPERKFMIVSRHWPTEAAQRNDGLKLLRDEGCGWCLIVDDDEMYNRVELERVIKTVLATTDPMIRVFAIHALVYWKNRSTVIEGLPAACPMIITTLLPGRAFFNEARNCLIDGSWVRIPPEVCVMHHLSYVRDDEKIRRKMKAFSHAGETESDWFDRIWMKWHPGMENLHPNPKAPDAFKRAVPVAGLPWILEELPKSL